MIRSVKRRATNCNLKRYFRPSPALQWMHPSDLNPEALREELTCRNLPIEDDENENIKTLCINLNRKGGYANGLTTDLNLISKKRAYEAYCQQIAPKQYFESEILVESRYYNHLINDISEMDRELISAQENPFRIVLKGRYEDVCRLRENIMTRRSECMADELNEIVYVIPNALAPKLSSSVLHSMKQESGARYHLYKLKNNDTYLLVIQGKKSQRMDASNLLEKTFSDAFTKNEFTKSRKKKKNSQQFLDELTSTNTNREMVISMYIDSTSRELIIHNTYLLDQIAGKTGTTIKTYLDDPQFYRPFEIHISGDQLDVEIARDKLDSVSCDVRNTATCITLPYETLKSFESNWQTLTAHIQENLNVEIKYAKDGAMVLVYLTGDLEMRKQAVKIIEYQKHKTICMEALQEQHSLRRRKEEIYSIDFMKYNIGGLDDQLGVMIRRAFASRCISPQLKKEMGISHTKGVLLHGPPGTGKSLVARKLSEILGCDEPKIINSPEIESKWVGEAEKNIRALFEEAIKDHNDFGADSKLHVVIFDELDAIAKRRGGAHAKSRDGALNQLLCSLDGIKEIDNLLVFGLTNRMDSLDPALLRPGRLEVQIEIGLPDEAGRDDILNIHTRAMRRYGRIDEEVELQTLAQYSEGFSGADLAGFVRNAQSYAIEEFLEEDECRVTQDHLERALQECRQSKLKQPPAVEKEQEESGLALV